MTLAATRDAIFPRRRTAPPPPAFRHGRFALSILSDGALTLGGEILAPDAAPPARAALLARLGGDAAGAPVRMNLPLIRAGDELIAIDAGAGDAFQASAGRLARNLAAAGIDRRAVTRVILTHAHPDHVGGVIQPDGELLFPNADHHVGRVEWDFWTDPRFEERRPPALHGFARTAARALDAVAERLHLHAPGDEVVPGLRLLATPGHTPGHMSVELDGPEPLLLVGDACTHDVVFFENPGWRFGFDTDPDLALATRRRLLDRAAADRLLVLGCHWTRPLPGRVERRGAAYRLAPA
ncbi:MBL fold metallo-hydrolase [Albimonas pacifica]|uniref:Glyoxylase, beta-lactamase superfamily II n=1 Tax=Albimonas pacifica TaxID=1114924 RepID=A0A1I3FRG1_9RHOB|nr:MBL fold metallo-hydrolase [Albimonas pacifica]SFI13789.1 Glyoxylase, beta-lactamase superfamily II [Albimonas pacifica]